MKLTRIIAVLAWMVSPLWGVQIVTETPHVHCRTFHFHQDLSIYKDPTLFLPNLSLIYADPVRGWEALMEESPLLTKVKGDIVLMLLSDKPAEFKNFGAVARLYEMADPRFKFNKKESSSPVKILPIKMCGEPNDPYRDTVGFVIEEDLKKAQVEILETGKLPPSVYPNPIPKLE